MNRHYSNLTLVQSALCAARGLVFALRTQPNMWLLAAGIWTVVLLARWTAVPPAGLAVLAVALGLPVAAELLNTAVEQAIDLVVREFHPQARAAKDIAAAGVLMSVLVAVAATAFVLWPPWLWPAVVWAALLASPAVAGLSLAAIPALAAVGLVIRRRGDPT